MGSATFWFDVTYISITDMRFPATPEHVCVPPASPGVVSPETLMPRTLSISAGVRNVQGFLACAPAIEQEASIRSANTAVKRFMNFSFSFGQISSACHPDGVGHFGRKSDFVLDLPAFGWVMKLELHAAFTFFHCDATA